MDKPGPGLRSGLQRGVLAALHPTARPPPSSLPRVDSGRHRGSPRQAQCLHCSAAPSSSSTERLRLTEGCPLPSLRAGVREAGPARQSSPRPHATLRRPTAPLGAQAPSCCVSVRRLDSGQRPRKSVGKCWPAPCRGRRGSRRTNRPRQEVRQVHAQLPRPLSLPVTASSAWGRSLAPTLPAPAGGPSPVPAHDPAVPGRRSIAHQSPQSPSGPRGKALPPPHPMCP